MNTPEKLSVLVAFYKEAINELEEDFNNVKTDHGRTEIGSAIDKYKVKLREAEQQLKTVNE